MPLTQAKASSGEDTSEAHVQKCCCHIPLLFCKELPKPASRHNRAEIPRLCSVTHLLPARSSVNGSTNLYLQRRSAGELCLGPRTSARAHLTRHQPSPRIARDLLP